MMMVFALLPSGAQTVFTSGVSGQVFVRSDAAGSLQCDSIVAEDYDGKAVDKIVNRYDEDGNLAGKTRYVWNDMSGSWSPDARYEYLYDADRNVTASVYAIWELSRKGWLNSEKIESTYNDQRKILSQDAYKWENEAWVPTSMGRATYDANGYLASEYSMIYDAPGQKWLALTKNEYTSDEAGQWLLAVSYMGRENSDEFAPSFRTHYEYFGTGKMTLRYMQDWDPAQNDWTDTSKQTWTYDAAGNEAGSLSQFKDFDTGLLKETAKHEKEYDERGNLVLNRFYNKDTENNWVFFTKEEYTYNDRDSVMEKISYNRDFMSGELVASMRNTFTYDDRGNRASQVSYYWGGDHWVNSLKEERVCNGADQLLSTRKYFWTPGNTPESGTWSENFKEDLTYDSNGYQNSYASYSYNRIAGVWTGLAKSESRYDEYGNILEETAYQWIEDTEEFRKSGRIVYYYSAPSAIETVVQEEIKLLVHDRLIEVCGAGDAEIRLFDLSGKFLSGGNRTVRVSQEGCYLVNVNGKQTFKVVVK